MSETQGDLSFHKVTDENGFPEWTDREQVESFLFTALGQFGDPIEDIHSGVDYAFGKGPAPKKGFVMLARLNEELVGALVMMNTGMARYIPGNILLYVAVDPSTRGKGVGRQLIDHSIAQCEGDVKLHVEFENPAKRLYERIGFTNKYAEMRYSQ